MGKVALVVTLLGFVGLVVGLIGTIAFSASDEFVKATLYCNSTNKDPNCNTANTVIDDDGNVCQVGNLGLFVSSYTPGCAVGTTYELNAALEPITDAPTTEFGILFPAQTNFAGLGEQLGFPAEFTTCAAYFEDASIETGIAGIVAGQNASLDTLRLGLKEGFDNGLDDIEALLDDAIQGVGAGLEGVLVLAGLSVADISAPLGASPNWIAGASAALPGLPASINGSVGLALQGIATLTIGGGVCTSTADCLDKAGYVNTPDWGATGANVASSSEIGIGTFGFFSEYNAPFCGGTSCTYEEYLIDVLLPGAIASGNAENIARLTLVIGAVDTYFTGFLEESGLALTKENARDFLAAYRDDPAFPSVTASPSPAATGLAILPPLSKAGFLQVSKDSLPLADTIPKSLNTPAALQSQGFGILCPTLGLAPTCNFVDVINQAVANDNGLDGNVTAGLLGAQQLVTSCVEDGVNDFDECLQNVVASSVITGLYDGPDELSSLETYLANATEQCLDDELDIAAITQAQQLIPVGAGLNGAGLAIAVLALVLYALGKNIKVAKVVILVGAVISLIGLALAVVALLGVIGAPIYASVGGDGDGLEDGDQVFSNSVGYQYILAGAAGNAIGGILLLAGGLCLPTAESDALAAK